MQIRFNLVLINGFVKIAKVLFGVVLGRHANYKNGFCTLTVRLRILGTVVSTRANLVLINGIVILSKMIVLVDGCR